MSWLPTGDQAAATEAKPCGGEDGEVHHCGNRMNTVFAAETFFFRISTGVDFWEAKDIKSRASEDIVITVFSVGVLEGLDRVASTGHAWVGPRS